MPRPKGSKNKKAPQIAKEAKEKLDKQLSKIDCPVKTKEVSEAIAELEDVADLLGGDDSTSEEVTLPQDPEPTPKDDEVIVIPKTTSRTPRLVGRHPITKEPVYK